MKTTNNVFDVSEVIREKRLNTAHLKSYEVYEKFVFETINMIYNMDSEPCSVSSNGVEVFHIGEPHKIDGVSHNSEHCANSTGSELIKQECIERNFVSDSLFLHEMPNFQIIEFIDEGSIRIVVKLGSEQHDRLVPAEIEAAVRKCAIKEDRHYLMPTRAEMIASSGISTNNVDAVDG